jgi:ubiquinone/menaquinone biosynthesis C-methylase UbiE
MMTGGGNLTFKKIDPKDYERWYQTKEGSCFNRLEKELILKMINPNPAESLLEVGCGTGHFLKWLSKFKLKLAGVDIAPKMIAYASQNLLGNIELKVADADNLPFKDNSFDAVMFITALEFLDKPKEALKEAIRVSKDKVFIGFLNKLSFLALKRRIKGFFKDSVYNEAAFYSIFDIKKMLEETNSRVRIDKIEGIKTKLGPFTSISPFIGVLIKKDIPWKNNPPQAGRDYRD